MQTLARIAARTTSLAIACAIAASSCAPEQTAPSESVHPGATAEDARRKRRRSFDVGPNVVLVTLDTVRADHLSCYGYGRPTSPELDAFAQHSDLYTRSYSTAPWTLPSHASMFTGLFPFQHGARTIPVETERGNVTRLSSDHTTLAEFLGEAGYETVAFVANAGFMTETFNVHQGFDRYEVKRMGGTLVTRRARSWLEKREGGRPFFLFVNYMDAHRPYNDIPRNPELPRASTRASAPLLDELMEIAMGTDEPLPVELVDDVNKLYDAGISNADFAFGALVRDFQRLGLMRDTLFIVTSDHGEYLGEHRLVEHSKDVYQEALHVPLIVRWPGQRAGRRIDEPVCSVDVPSFVLDALPEELADRGRAIFPFRPGNHPVLAENYYTRPKDLFHPIWGKRFERVRFALYAGDYKYIQSTDRNNELYNLREDPRELRDLSAQERDVAARFTKALHEFRQRAHRSEASDGAPPVLSKEEIEELRALGYM